MYVVGFPVMLPQCILITGKQHSPRACLKKAFCKIYLTICGKFCPDEGTVAGYGSRIRVEYTAKWDVQIAGMIQARSSSGNYTRYWKFP